MALIRRRGSDAPPQQPQARPPERKMATVEVPEVPSGKLPYPDAVISYRPYTYEEIDAFNDSTLGQASKLEFVLDGIQASGMDAADLTLNDALYIALLRKMSSLGTSEFTLTVTHTAEDGQASEHASRFSLDDVDFEELDVPGLPVVVDVDGVEMHFSPLTAGAYIELTRMVEAERAARERAKETPRQAAPNSREVMAAQCVNVPYGKALELINGSTGTDMLNLIEVDGMFAHGVRPLAVRYEVDGKEVSRNVKVSDPDVLVYPFRGSKVHKGPAIRFGLHGHGDD